MSAIDVAIWLAETEICCDTSDRSCADVATSSAVIDAIDTTRDSDSAVEFIAAARSRNSPGNWSVVRTDRFPLLSSRACATRCDSGSLIDRTVFSTITIGEHHRERDGHDEQPRATIVLLAQLRRRRGDLRRLERAEILDVAEQRRHDDAGTLAERRARPRRDRDPSSRCAVAYLISISDSFASMLAISVTSCAIWPGRLFISRCTRCVSQLSRWNSRARDVSRLSR